jgi:hypothetical protein
MSRQWLRKVSLVVGDSGGRGLDLSALRIRFSTRSGDLQTPNSADIRIYNLSEETAQQVQREFTRIVLQAGYVDNFGVIFDGTIKQFRRGRESGTDTYLDVFAGDGDAAYNYAVVNKTLAAGSTTRDRVSACSDSMAEHGVSEGHIPELGGPRLPRGQVLYGMARDYMRVSGQSSDTSWSIQDGKITMIPRDSYLPGEAIVLTAKTGLVGTPEQTQDGIKARCLLNPQIGIGRRVKIDNRSILRAKVDMSYTAINMLPKVSSDGFYRVLLREYSGDTHGTDWYTDLTCIALDDTVPASMAAKGGV